MMHWYKTDGQQLGVILWAMSCCSLNFQSKKKQHTASTYNTQSKGEHTTCERLCVSMPVFYNRNMIQCKACEGYIHYLMYGEQKKAIQESVRVWLLNTEATENSLSFLKCLSAFKISAAKRRVLHINVL